MKRYFKKLAGCVLSACVLLAGTTAALNPAYALTKNTVGERAEVYTTYDASQDLKIIFQKAYSAYCLTASYSGRATYADVTINVVRPLIFLDEEHVVYDTPVANMNITLPLSNGTYSWMLPIQSIPIESGDIIKVSASYYNMANNEKQYVDAANGTLSLCGGENLKSSVDQDFYINGYSDGTADTADVRVMIKRPLGQNYSTVSSTYAKIPLNNHIGTIKLDRSALNYSDGDVVMLDYTLTKNGQKVTDSNTSVTFSNKPGRQKGDLNADGFLSELDADILIGFLACDDLDEADENEEISLRTADLNGDGKITVKDLSILKSMAIQ
ncbi:MAG: dockerin type I domain-containing protein [Oscillospiraceae bacterium]|nr:dockerin type I domain-containing protein [Oscillospiraceae bacterium]